MERSSAKHDTYRHLPLAQGHARFLELLHDAPNTPLRCRIITCHLGDAPPYEALSYVWGRQEPLYNLQCSDASVDDDTTSILRMGPNLHMVPLRLRMPPTVDSAPKLLWIDRICINQDDAEERASQVWAMRFIYRRCEQTLVWLGEEDWDTKDAFDCARYIYDNDLGHRETPVERLQGFRSPPVSFVKLGNALRALVTLTYRPWFERAWTFQEAVLPSTVSLVCGGNRMHFECLESCIEPTVEHFSIILSGSARLVLSTRRIDDTFPKDSGRLPNDDLERLLNFRRQAKASDPRDLILSLLGLFPLLVSHSLAPNYSISVKDLFSAATRHIIRESNELRTICSVESPKHLEGELLPSRVPDWRASRESCQNVLHDRNPRSEYRATRESRYSNHHSPDTDELRLNGILIGIVSQAGEFNQFHSISDFNLGERYSHTNQAISTALRQAQTLDFDLDLEDEKIPLWHRQRRNLADFYDIPKDTDLRRQKCKQCLMAHAMPIMSIKDVSNNPELATLARHCNKTVRTRAFFISDLGHIGFGPKCTVAGDQIYLLIGSDLPFVLRPAGSKFELVGACYVHGIMYGEDLHKSIGFNSHFYPGSNPGDEWDFSFGKVRPARWMKVAANGHVWDENGHFHGHVTDFTLSGTLSESGREVQRFVFCEIERHPVVIETENTILK